MRVRDTETDISMAFQRLSSPFAATFLSIFFTLKKKIFEGPWHGDRVRITLSQIFQWLFNDFPLHFPNKLHSPLLSFLGVLVAELVQGLGVPEAALLGNFFGSLTVGEIGLPFVSIFCYLAWLFCSLLYCSLQHFRAE